MTLSVKISLKSEKFPLSGKGGRFLFCILFSLFSKQISSSEEEEDDIILFAFSRRCFFLLFVDSSDDFAVSIFDVSCANVNFSTLCS